MTLPAAGWFPDPQNADRIRWWDGVTWGDATQPAPGIEPAATGDRAGAVLTATARAAETPARPVFSVRASSTEPSSWAYGSGVAAAWSGGRVEPPRRLCVLSWGALVVAAASAVQNPYGALGVVALLVAIVGLCRPRSTGGWRLAARSAAISAIVLAMATTIIAVVGAIHIV